MNGINTPRILEVALISQLAMDVDPRQALFEDNSEEDNDVSNPEYEVQEAGDNTMEKGFELSPWPPVQKIKSGNTVKKAPNGNVYVADGYVADGKLNSNHTAGEKGRVCRKYCVTLCELLVVGTLVLIILGLFTLPTVYFIQTKEEAKKLVSSNTTQTSTCSEVAAYSGEVCRDQLMSLQMCFSGASSPLNIPATIDLQQGETEAQRLQNGLLLLNPSDRCLEGVQPFLCLHMFSLCDTGGTLHTTLREECLDVRDNLCAAEWERAAFLLPPGTLPVCEDLPDLTDECAENNSSAGEANITLSSNKSTSFQNESFECAETFFFDANGTNLCRPICGEFRRSPLYEIIITDIAMCVVFSASVVMFVLALTVQRDTLLVFPSVLLVYMCITCFCISTMIIVGFFANNTLFCGSRDFIQANTAGNETPYCIFTGIFFVYFMEQICMWAALHVVFLFWAVGFPFNYRQLRISGRVRYAHGISILLAIILPLPAALAQLEDGFFILATPTLFCNGRNADRTYYLFVLPLCLLLAMTSILLVFILWIIVKEFVIKKMLSGKKAGRIGKAQVKITFVIAVYIVVGVVSLVALTYYEVNASVYSQAFIDYFICQSKGNSEDCTLDIVNIVNVTILSTMVIVALPMLPVTAILFSIDPKACGKKKKGVKASTSTGSKRL